MSKGSDQILSFTAPSEPEGRPRLDKFLSSQTQIISRTRLKSLIESGNVTVAGEKVTEPSHRVNSGEEILVVIPPARPACGPPPAMHVLALLPTAALSVMSSLLAAGMRWAPQRHSSRLQASWSRSIDLRPLGVRLHQPKSRLYAAKALSAESPQQSAVVAYSRDFRLSPGQLLNSAPAG